MARVGRQAPTFEVVGRGLPTDGAEAVAAFGEYGFGFDGAQRHEMDVYLMRDGDGRPAAVTIGLSKPRQNGKSYAARWYAVWCAAVCGMAVVYSAHNGDAVHEFFDMLCSVFCDEDNYPDLAELLDGRPYRQPGKERICFTGGGRIKFVTRTNSGSRGGTCDVIVVDEAQELTDAQLNAMLPILSAGPHGAPQAIYVGTPPDATCPGTVFARMHDAAHSDDPGDAWWMEWAAPELPPADASEDELLDLAYETNPALGTRITERAVRNEIAQMTPDGFARERLGWWPARGAVAVPLLDPAKWDAARVADEVGESASGKMAFGVKFSPDGRRAAVSCCIRPADGSPDYVELVDMGGTGAGVAWLTAMVMRHASEVSLVAVDGRAGAAALANQLAAQGLPRRALHECATADVASAAAMMVEAVNAGTVCHIASPSMDESATRSIRRDIGKNGAFSFGDGPDSTSLPVESAALALWAVRTTRRDPTRKQRVW